MVLWIALRLLSRIPTSIKTPSFYLSHATALDRNLPVNRDGPLDRSEAVYWDFNLHWVLRYPMFCPL
jgi:hypothetical protein